MSSQAHYCQCSRIGHSVNVNQTEGACRDQHACSDDPCPLEAEFGQSRFQNAIQALSAQIGQALSFPGK